MTTRSLLRSIYWSVTMQACDSTGGQSVVVALRRDQLVSREALLEHYRANPLAHIESLLRQLQKTKVLEVAIAEIDGIIQIREAVQNDFALEGSQVSILVQAISNCLSDRFRVSHGSVRIEIDLTVWLRKHLYWATACRLQRALLPPTKNESVKS